MNGKNEYINNAIQIIDQNTENRDDDFNIEDINNKKKKISSIERACQQFKKTMIDLRKKQTLILKSFFQKIEAKKLDEIRQRLSDKNN